MKSGDDLGPRWVVEPWPGLRCYRVTDVATGEPTAPGYLSEADAQTAANRLNGPRRPTTQQGDLFQQPQEA